MNTFAKTVTGLTQKLGLAGKGVLAGLAANSALVKLLLALLLLPIGSILLVMFFGGRQIVMLLRTVFGWIAAKPLLALLVLASAAWLGVGLWRVYDHWHEQRLSLAVGARTADSHRLGQALQAITAAHYPRLKMVLLEIEDATGNAGVMEKGVVQLAIVPATLSAGASVRSVATLPGSSPQVLVARYDVDEQVTYALAQILTQFSAELAPPKTSGKAAAPTANPQKPPATSAAPLHPGAAAFYDREQTPLLRRYAKLVMFMLTGLVLLTLWGWLLRRRAQRQPLPKPQPIGFSSEPWTFAKILRESVEAPAPPPAPPSSDEIRKAPFRFQWRKRHA